MITAFFKDNGTFRFTREVQSAEEMRGASWIDVLRPTPEEKDILRAALTSNSPSSIRPSTMRTIRSS